MTEKGEMSSFLCSLIGDEQTFSVKFQTVNILGFEGNKNSVITVKHSHCSIKPTIDSTEVNGMVLF